ncbi:MAG TPA: rod-binding protein [Rhizomicrobium sp.]|jgi:Rod binding domain-containing protein|nr:rod-binding protein [Rhizomicrobium sp.]
MDAGLQNATGMIALAQSQNVTAPHATTNKAAAEKAAKQFEAVFISQFLGQMFEGIKTDGPMGGGQGEQMFRSLMLDQYGEQIAKHGGFGLSDAITRSLLSHQEEKP